VNEENYITISIYGKSKPLPKQLEFHKSKAKFRAYVGGYGSGKTYCGSWEAFMLSMQYPGTVGVVCRNSYPELRDSTRATFFKVLAEITEIITGKPGDPFEPTTCPLVKSFSRSGNELVFQMMEGQTPSTILFRSLDTPEKFKSLEIGWGWIDEASDSNEQAFLLLSGRLRHTSQAGGHTIFLTTNPCNTRHWLYRRFVEEKNEGTSLFMAPTSENPYLPEGYEDELRRTLPVEMVRRYVEGEFGSVPEGQSVYPGFCKKKHVEKVVYNPQLPIVRSWDFGLRHPACLIGQINKDRLIILAEIQGENELINDFGRRVKEFCSREFGQAVYRDYCDPAGKQKSDKSPHTSIEVLNGMGVHPQCSAQHILDGILIVGMLLQDRPDGEAGLIVDPSCRILIEGFEGGYHYPKKYDGRGGDPNPEKDGYYDHLQDTLRYLVWNTEFRTWLKKRLKKSKSANTFDFWKDLDVRRKGDVVPSFRI